VSAGREPSVHGDVVRLREEISRAFAPVPHPGADEINPCPCCPDHDAMTAWWGVHTWQDFEAALEAGTLDSEFMPSLPAGYQYFLPAVLRYTLGAYSRDGDGIWESTSVRGACCGPVASWIDKVLVPVFADPHITDFKENVRRLDLAQRAVAAECLTFFLERCPDEEGRFREDLRRALVEVWSEVDQAAPGRAD
jgi:hypothetical protein